jgi:hypothetical protein
MTAMKTATLLLVAAVAFAGVAHGEQPEDALDGSARRDLLNRQQPQQQPRNNRVKVVNPTFQNAQTGDGGKGGNGGISLLDGNSIAIALIPLGGGAKSGNTNGNYANGGNGGDSGPATNWNQNNVLGVAGRKLLTNFGWSNSEPQQGRNTNRVKVVDITGQNAMTGNGGKGGNGGLSVADANSIAAALLPFLGGATSGNTRGNFANGGDGGNSGPATNSNQNNVGAFAGGRKLLTSSWGGEGNHQPQQGRTTNGVKVINLTGQNAMTGKGGNGGIGGISALDGNSIAIALIPLGGGATSGNTNGNYANGGNGGNSGAATNWNKNNVGVIGGGK